MSVVRARRRADRVITAPAERRAAVLNTIRQARHRLTLSLFRCTDNEIVLEIARAVDRGVRVDVLVTSRSKGRKKLRRLWAALETTGAAIHPYADPVVKYHAKYLVADDGPAVVASLNFTRKCFRSTIDALVITHDPAVVDGLRRLQDADREGVPIPTNLPERLIIGPELARRQLTALIQGARSSIRLIDVKLSDPVLVKLLEARRREGLTVDLHAARRLNGLRSHGKLMLIDNRIAMIGSLALAALSLDFRREVALVVQDPTAVAVVARLFDSVAACESTPVATPALSGRPRR
ncbi:MAG: phospholipase D/Transphosphatidylase [Acidobacteria bacterium]|nr:phospholipase D/Transphosphatidylase [Acidobacteriota bacterium]